MDLTFDAAGTLIEVHWEPVGFALQCARDVGLDLDQNEAGALYGHLMRSRWGHYCELNLTRDPEACDGWWRELTREWLARLGRDESLVDPIASIVRQRLYTPESDVFRLYRDTLPCLEALRAAGHRMAILSNWDYTLHRVVKMLGLEPYFETVVASLEEGPEKPDPQLFRIALERLGSRADRCVHIGDNPLDDLRGAQQSGMRAILLDRSAEAPRPPIVRSLLDVPAAVAGATSA